MISNYRAFDRYACNADKNCSTIVIYISIVLVKMWDIFWPDHIPDITNTEMNNI